MEHDQNIATNTVDLNFFYRDKFAQIDKVFNEDYGVAFTTMSPPTRPCFNHNFVTELFEHHSNIQKTKGAIVVNTKIKQINYLVLNSSTPGTFSMGGDISQLRIAIKNKAHAWLKEYAYLCVENLWLIHRMQAPITTIALVEGDAIGAGFDCAIAADIVIATRGSQLGLPKIAFNLASSIATMSLLARKIGIENINKIALAQRTFSAEELYDMGVVDVLANEGEGMQALNNWIETTHEELNSFQGIQNAKKIIGGLKKQELFDVADIWVDSALNLSAVNLERMKLSVSLQNTHKTLKIG